MENAKMKPENSKDESTQHDHVLELGLIGLLAALMGRVSEGWNDRDNQEASVNR